VLEEKLFGRDGCKLLSDTHVGRPAQISSLLVGKEEDASVGNDRQIALGLNEPLDVCFELFPPYPLKLCS
jgi:hypothetical protein